MTGLPGAAGSDAPRSVGALIMLAVASGVLFAGFVALGSWQVERRAWKLALIERVEQRIHAAPVDAPGRADWPRVSAARDEYRHVRLAGRFLHHRETLVQAATTLGAGHWVLTPLQAADGTVVLVNRGFMPSGRRPAARAAEPGGDAVVTGLLRLTEPGGGFLRRNDPAANRWYSRDVQAIAAARGLAAVAPYFIDADAVLPSLPARGIPENDDLPVGGLTVTAFHNSHLAYALTWYTLALMVAAAALQVVRLERRARRGRKVAIEAQ